MLQDLFLLILLLSINTNLHFINASTYVNGPISFDKCIHINMNTTTIKMYKTSATPAMALSHQSCSSLV